MGPVVVRRSALVADAHGGELAGDPVGGPSRQRTRRCVVHEQHEAIVDAAVADVSHQRSTGPTRPVALPARDRGRSAIRLAQQRRRWLGEPRDDLRNAAHMCPPGILPQDRAPAARLPAGGGARCHLPNATRRHPAGRDRRMPRRSAAEGRPAGPPPGGAGTGPPGRGRARQRPAAVTGPSSRARASGQLRGSGSRWHPSSPPSSSPRSPIDPARSRCSSTPSRSASTPARVAR
jgi:hypothetical protein